MSLHRCCNRYQENLLSILTKRTMLKDLDVALACRTLYTNYHRINRRMDSSPCLKPSRCPYRGENGRGGYVLVRPCIGAESVFTKRFCLVNYLKEFALDVALACRTPYLNYHRINRRMASSPCLKLSRCPYRGENGREGLCLGMTLHWR